MDTRTEHLLLHFEARCVSVRRQLAIEGTQVKSSFLNRVFQRLMKITLFDCLKTGVEVDLSRGLENREVAGTQCPPRLMGVSSWGATRILTTSEI
jgi:hypothetical protein